MLFFFLSFLIIFQFINYSLFFLKFENNQENKIRPVGSIKNIFRFFFHFQTKPLLKTPKARYTSGSDRQATGRLIENKTDFELLINNSRTLRATCEDQTRLGQTNQRRNNNNNNYCENN